MKTTTVQADDLRNQLTDALREAGTVHRTEIERAFRTVPRHLFLPDLPADEAYANKVVITKRNEDGDPLVSASKPTVIAMMLEQLEPEPGDRILEIGAGTGYNAALLRELVGADGEITTVEIDPEAAQQAKERLESAGYTDVRVITGDGSFGERTHAPYDRIIVTAGAWDIPPAWWEQLNQGGRMVVPLRWRGLTRTVAFDLRGGVLVSQDMIMCGFIPMQGSGGEHALPLADDVTIFYDEDQAISAGTLDGVLDRPRSEAWSSITVGGNDPFDGVWLRLSTAEPGTCRIAAKPTAVETGRVTPAIPNLNPAVVEKESLAYFVYRSTEDSGLSELGAVGHGPEGKKLAERICDEIRIWNEDRDAIPEIRAYRAGTLDDQSSTATVINKKCARLTYTWP